jgi:hypothetical protein
MSKCYASKGEGREKEKVKLTSLGLLVLCSTSAAYLSRENKVATPRTLDSLNLHSAVRKTKRGLATS